MGVAHFESSAVEKLWNQVRSALGVENITFCSNDGVGKDRGRAMQVPSLF